MLGDDERDDLIADAHDRVYRDPINEYARRFTHEWAARNGKDPHGPEAEAIFEEAYNDASQAGDF